MSGSGDAATYQDDMILHDVNSNPVLTQAVVSLDVQSQSENSKTKHESNKNEETLTNGKCQEVTNGLIDDFSTQLTMSLINSSISPKEQTICDQVTSTDTASESQPLHTATSQHDMNFNPLVCECDGISYWRYKDETQMSAIMQLITKDLSEPYSIYTYRYFIHNWPQLCFLVGSLSYYIYCMR